MLLAHFGVTGSASLLHPHSLVTVLSVMSDIVVLVGEVVV